METLVKKEIRITERQRRLLQELARRHGVSEDEAVGQAIEREAAADAAGSAGERAWQQAKQSMLSLREQIPEGAEPYHWSREELYPDRGGRCCAEPGQAEAGA